MSLYHRRMISPIVAVVAAWPAITKTIGWLTSSILWTAGLVTFAQTVIEDISPVENPVPWVGGSILLSASLYGFTILRAAMRESRQSARDDSEAKDGLVHQIQAQLDAALERERELLDRRDRCDVLANRIMVYEMLAARHGFDLRGLHEAHRRELGLGDGDEIPPVPV